jgi:hypothetical protein
VRRRVVHVAFGIAIEAAGRDQCRSGVPYLPDRQIMNWLDG